MVCLARSRFILVVEAKTTRVQVNFYIHSSNDIDLDNYKVTLNLFKDYLNYSGLRGKVTIMLEIKKFSIYFILVRISQ